MLYRQAGIRHRTYSAERQLWPLGFDRMQIGLVAAVLLAAPILFDRFIISSYLLPWLLWSSAALGLNLLMGTAGQIHLGYGAVMAIGAYGAVHLLRAGVPLELTLILVGLLSAMSGIIFGAVALRVKGLYLAMSTLAMQYIVDFVISHAPGISGGSQASIQMPRTSIFGIPIVGEVTSYYVALGLCTIITLFMLNVGRTGFGRALAAVREKDYAAEIIGIDTFKYKMLAFWVSSFIGGVVGAAVGICYLRTVTPDQFHLDLSIQLVAMVIVGGLGSVLGSFFGAALVLFAPIFFNNLVGMAATTFSLPISIDLRAHIPLMLYGGLIIFFLLVEPLGLAKLYDNVRKYFLVWPFRHVRK